MNELSVPERVLSEIHTEIPYLTRSVSEILSHRGDEGFPEWEKYCFLPFYLWQQIAYLAIYDDYPPRLNKLTYDAQAVGTWQYSKGFYSFDIDFALELIESPITDDIPVNVLMRLPEFCVWIDLNNVADDLPDPHNIFQEARGFFVYLDYDIYDKTSKLIFNIPYFGTFPFELGDYSIHIALDRLIEYLINLEGPDSETKAEIIQNRDSFVYWYGNLFGRLLNLVLYLCVDEPDIQTDREPGYSKYRAEPVKTKKGIKLFPSDKLHHHQVGRKFGNILRQTYLMDAETEPLDWQGGTKRAHLRRGHWQGYWKGPRKAEVRDFIFHWIPPMIVGGKR